MIKFEHTEVVGWEAAIRGMRNPMNSWAKSDTKFDVDSSPTGMWLGANDKKLMRQLIKAGSVHRKFLRMITVYVDITAPLYWWKEFDTYKVGTVANSCSTMHKIQAKEFTLDDFSHDRIIDDWETFDVYVPQDAKEYLLPINILKDIIECLNQYRKLYLNTKEKIMWWQMIQLLPSSYNQKRTIMINYEVLKNIFQPDCRLHHKLDEWNIDIPGSFCDWIKSLPYSELITETEGVE